MLMQTKAVTAASAAQAATGGAAAWYTLGFLGIGWTSLLAAIIGAAIMHLPRDGQPEKAVPSRLLGIMADAFLGGWLATVILVFTPAREYGLHLVPPPAVAGLCAVVIQWLRANLGRMVGEAWTAAIDIAKRRFGGSGG